MIPSGIKGPMLCEFDFCPPKETFVPPLGHFRHLSSRQIDGHEDDSKNGDDDGEGLDATDDGDDDGDHDDEAVDDDDYEYDAVLFLSCN